MKNLTDYDRGYLEAINDYCPYCKTDTSQDITKENGIFIQTCCECDNSWNYDR